MGDIMGQIGVIKCMLQDTDEIMPAFGDFMQTLGASMQALTEYQMTDLGIPSMSSIGSLISNIGLLVVSTLLVASVGLVIFGRRRTERLNELRRGTYRRM